jgi:hypothetical protein
VPDPKPPDCRRTAREHGLAPALSVLCSDLLPGMMPCGPRGHAVVPAEIAAAADRVWLNDRVSARANGDEVTLLTATLPGGPVVVSRHIPGSSGGTITDNHDAWQLGLVWLRFGLSEGLLDTCVRYLGGRASRGTTLLRQQLVKGSIAEVLIEHLEIRAVLSEAGNERPSPATIAHLQQQISHTDRKLLRLLGASGFLAGGPGEVAHLSELLADSHAVVQECT